MALQEYNRKRNFKKTREPRGKTEKSGLHRFVVQEHHASTLHYDFRLEMNGVLKSWAVPRGPSLDPRQKRLAVMTEDHPVKYLNFEGNIAEGNYGAGEMRIWDRGRYEPASDEDPQKQIEKGRLGIILHGEKLCGEFNLVRMNNESARGDKPGKQWLLIKGKDKFADSDWQLEPILREKGKRQQPARVNARSKKPSVRKFQVKGEGVAAAKALQSKNLRGDLRVEVDGHVVALTSLDKLYWPDDGYTKADLARYYLHVAETMLTYLRDRPLILKRYPMGIKQHFFFQHDVDEVPDYVDTFPTQALGHAVDYVICNNAATLLYLANLGVIPIHPWHSRVKNIDRPDWFVLDLDPGKVEFDIVRQVALIVREVLTRLGLDSYAKTSGSRGMHVYVPIQAKYTYEQVADFAERVAKLIVSEAPEQTTLVRSLRSRKPNRIYIDHLQNAQGKTIVAPYSVRERPGATVSAPLDWSEVKRDITPKDFTIKNMPARIAKKGDLFEEVLTNKQTLDGAIKKLEQLEKPKTRRAKK